MDLRILPPTGTCPDLGELGAYVVMTWEGTEYLGCTHGPCPAGATQPGGCLAGVETLAVEAGKTFKTKAMVFGSPPTGAPVLCGETVAPDVGTNLEILDIRLECAETCAGGQPCDPVICWNVQKELCPEFHP